MRYLRTILFTLGSLSLAWCFPSFSAAATGQAERGVFTSVSGKVTVTRKGRSRKARPTVKVQEGETVATSGTSSATLRFFDGSELQVKPGTRFTIGALRKVGGSDKVLKFKLVLGKLFAAVQKLSTSRSSFEIEAGGVACGVRGTQYEVDYDGSAKVDLFVKEGNVWVLAGGNTYQYGPGNEGHFNDGKPSNPPTGNDQGNKGQGKKGPNDQQPGPPVNFSPFLGMGGNRTDPLQPLTGGSPDSSTIGTLVNKTGDSTLLGLGNPSVILQLKYPEQ